MHCLIKKLRYLLLMALLLEQYPVPAFRLQILVLNLLFRHGLLQKSGSRHRMDILIQLDIPENSCLLLKLNQVALNLS